MGLQIGSKLRKGIVKRIIIISCLLISTSYIFNYNADITLTTTLNEWEMIDNETIFTINDDNEDDYLINTKNCYIPNYGRNISFIEVKDYNKTCGERAVFIQRKGNYNITFKIYSDILKKYMTNSRKDSKYFCCYRFASRSNITGKEDSQLNYTNCKNFEDNTTIPLFEEVVTVTCYNKKEQNPKSIFYTDSYILIKKYETKKDENDEKSWNVLMLGMDTMSRARVMNTMPSTVQYLKEHSWLDYRGYQKVGLNTFPNLISVVTGKKLNKIYKSCKYGMHKCNDLFIWTKFRQNGYITAYGEDNIALPDTFFRYNGFKTTPTHHYMRPFYITGEHRAGNLLCVHHMTSAQHMLGYVNEYINAYKNDKFFGFFWLNSYSHNPEYIPKKFDNEIVNFFESLEKSGIMDNTFVIFFSDHGIRFGDVRLQMESYYEERLPMFFIWTPREFRTLYPEKYYNLMLNQNRLVTPYDLHATLVKILNSSKDDNDEGTDACPQCSSLFEEKSLNRTCLDAGVDDKWCSCHGMTETDIKDPGANASLELVVSYIKNKTKEVKTKNCWICSKLELKSVLRIHWYKDLSDRKNYVIAFEMSPGNMLYEATVIRENESYRIADPTDQISPYNSNGNCVISTYDRKVCFCERAKCTNKL